MNLSQFAMKWKDIPKKHADTCERRDGFDFAVCTCGLDELWEQRNKDLRTVPDEELENFRKGLSKVKNMDKPIDSYQTFRSALREALSKAPAEHAPSFGPDVAVEAFDALLDLKEKETLANDELLAGELIRRLNAIIDSDDTVCADVARLIETRVPCDKRTFEHPTIQAVMDKEHDVARFGFLGLLNGVVGAIPVGPKKGWGYITASFDGPDDAELRKFSLTVSVVKQS